MPVERRRVLYQGRVQGVGFRATVSWLAQGVAVSGFVRNLPDGRVEVVAEGEPADLDAFLGAVEREFAGKVRGRDVEPMSVSEPPFGDFSIRY